MPHDACLVVFDIPRRRDERCAVGNPGVPSRRRRRLLAAVAASMLAPAGLALEAPSGKVVLTVTGDVTQRNAPDGAHFDMAMLERLPQLSFSTRTPWYAQARSFTGPRLRDVLAAAGAEGRTMRAVALNDYSVDIPVDDAWRYDVIVARLMDDQPMLVRDKGPLFIIYPFDSRPELRSAIFQSRSAWQLRRIEIR